MKTILVTGSTDGIGMATATELARKGCAVIVHGRNAQRAKAGAQEIVGHSGSESISTVFGDLASLEEVRQMASEIGTRFQRLDVLINNAGIASNERTVSKDGYESMFAINHLAPFLLTNLLLPLLKKSVPARIVNVASGAHSGAQLDLADLQMENEFEGWVAYSRSKLANILFTYELATRIAASGVTANCLHPGIINTKLLHVNYSGGSPVEVGARTSVYLALSDDVSDVSGEYFANEQLARSSANSRDSELTEKLWQACAELTNLGESESA